MINSRKKKELCVFKGVKMFFHDNKNWVRVSTIVEPYYGFNFSEMSPEMQQLIMRKGKIGTAVHSFISLFANGELAVLPQECVGYCQSFEKWYFMLQPDFVEVEQRYFDEEKILTGQMDAIIRFKGTKEDVLIDFKTSSNENKEAWSRQAHLYYHLLKKSGKTVGKNYIFLKLEKDGSMPKAFIYSYNSKLHEECLKLVDLFWAKHNSLSNNCHT